MSKKKQIELDLRNNFIQKSVYFKYEILGTKSKKLPIELVYRILKIRFQEIPTLSHYKKLQQSVNVNFFNNFNNKHHFINNFNNNLFLNNFNYNFNYSYNFGYKNEHLWSLERKLKKLADNGNLGSLEYLVLYYSSYYYAKFETLVLFQKITEHKFFVYTKLQRFDSDIDSQEDWKTTKCWVYDLTILHSALENDDDEELGDIIERMSVLM